MEQKEEISKKQRTIRERKKYGKRRGRRKKRAGGADKAGPELE